MSEAVLSHYLSRWGNLHRNRTQARGAAPHKPVLLLAFLVELDAGRISQNLVALTPELVASFQTLWSALVPADAHWKPRLSYPFRYLCQEGFWELVKDGAPVTIPAKTEPSLGQLAQLCDGGRFAADLWELLADPAARMALRHHLRETYFPAQEVSLQPDARDYLARQLAALRAQADATFRPKRVRERSDGDYVRHRLFPYVVKELYDDACCLCGLSARVGESSLIEAAHVLPFATFHNDDPRNGLALCANHHWGFDRGAWSLTDGYDVIVSPKLAASAGYLAPERAFTPPRDETCLPDPAALSWHRQRWGFTI